MPLPRPTLASTVHLRASAVTLGNESPGFCSLSATPAGKRPIGSLHRSPRARPARTGCMSIWWRMMRRPRWSASSAWVPPSSLRRMSGGTPGRCWLTSRATSSASAKAEWPEQRRENNVGSLTSNSCRLGESFFNSGPGRYLRPARRPPRGQQPPRAARTTEGVRTCPRATLRPQGD